MAEQKQKAETLSARAQNRLAELAKVEEILKANYMMSRVYWVQARDRFAINGAIDGLEDYWDRVEFGQLLLAQNLDNFRRHLARMNGSREKILYSLDKVPFPAVELADEMKRTAPIPKRFYKTMDRSTLESFYPNQKFSDADVRTFYKFNRGAALSAALKIYDGTRQSLDVGYSALQAELARYREILGGAVANKSDAVSGITDQVARVEVESMVNDLSASLAGAFEKSNPELLFDSGRDKVKMTAVSLEKFLLDNALIADCPPQLSLSKPARALQDFVDSKNLIPHPSPSRGSLEPQVEEKILSEWQHAKSPETLDAALWNSLSLLKDRQFDATALGSKIQSSLVERAKLRHSPGAVATKAADIAAQDAKINARLKLAQQALYELSGAENRYKVFATSGGKPQYRPNTHEEFKKMLEAVDPHVFPLPTDKKLAELDLNAEDRKSSVIDGHLESVLGEARAIRKPVYITRNLGQPQKELPTGVYEDMHDEPARPELIERSQKIQRQLKDYIAALQELAPKIEVEHKELSRQANVSDPTQMNLEPLHEIFSQFQSGQKAGSWAPSFDFSPEKVKPKLSEAQIKLSQEMERFGLFGSELSLKRRSTGADQLKRGFERIESPAQLLESIVTQSRKQDPSCTTVHSGKAKPDTASLEYQKFMARAFLRGICKSYPPEHPVLYPIVQEGKGSRNSYDALSFSEWTKTAPNGTRQYVAPDQPRTSKENLIPNFALLYALSMAETEGDPRRPSDFASQSSLNRDTGMFHMAATNMTADYGMVDVDPNGDFAKNIEKRLREFDKEDEDSAAEHFVKTIRRCADSETATCSVFAAETLLEYLQKIRQIRKDYADRPDKSYNEYEKLCMPSFFQDRYDGETLKVGRGGSLVSVTLEEVNAYSKVMNTENGIFKGYNKSNDKDEMWTCIDALESGYTYRNLQDDWNAAGIPHCAALLLTYCPAFSTDFAAILVRNRRKGNGDISETPTTARRKKVKASCQSMFYEVYDKKDYLCTQFP